MAFSLKNENDPKFKPDRDGWPAPPAAVRSGLFLRFALQDGANITYRGEDIGQEFSVALEVLLHPLRDAVMVDNIDDRLLALLVQLVSSFQRGRQ